MATYNLNVTASVDLLGSDISGSQSTDFAIANPLPASSYFTFETVRNSDGFYDSSSPKNMAGTYTLGAGLAGVVKSDYIASVVVEPGGGTLTFVPTNYISGSSLNLRGTSAPPPDLDAANFLAATGITGAVESAAITTLVADLKVAGIWSKMKAVYPFVTDNRNLFSYTEDFGNSYWTKANSTITTNNTTAPNGTLTADKLITSSGLTQGRFAINPSLSNVAYSVSIYAKQSQNLSLRIGVDGGYSCYYNLLNGSVGTQSNTIGTITNVGNGWYRCSISFTLASAGTTFVNFILVNNDESIYTGDGTSGIFLWGAQLELGSTATTYQPIATTQQSYISNQFKYNLKDPRDLDAAFRLVFNGGWTHSSTGATPNGTNGYADTRLNPSVSLTNNFSHISIYSRTNNILSQLEMGSWPSSGNRFLMALRYTGGNFEAEQYKELTSRVAVANSDSRGFYISSRTTSTNHKAYKNGSQFGSTNTGDAGNISNINLPLYIGAVNTTVFPGYSTKENAFASIGDGLTDTEVTNFYTAVQAFQTSLSRQV